HRETPADLDEDDAEVRIIPARRLEDRPRHCAVPARLVHQQPAQAIELALERELALEHRRAGDDTHAAGYHPRGHALGVGVDRMEDAGRAHTHILHCVDEFLIEGDSLVSVVGTSHYQPALTAITGRQADEEIRRE